MIISTKKGTPKEELEKIVDKFKHQGLDVTLITGKNYNVFGLVGDTTKIDERDVLANPWIDNVTRVSAPYKRANRLFHPADSVIDCGGVKIGGKEKIAVMAGPCSIEGAEQALRIAQTPVGVMKSKITDERSRDIFFVDVARSLGIEAQKDAVTGKIQYKKNGEWQDVKFDNTAEKTSTAAAVSYTHLTLPTKLEV